MVPADRSWTAGVRTTLVAALGVAALVGALVTPSAGAAAPRTGREPAHRLSPRLATLSAAALRTASSRRQARALSLPRRGPLSLMRDGDGVLVEIETVGGTGRTERSLPSLGVRTVHRSERYRTITALVPIGSLHDVAALPDVDVVTEILAPLLSGSLGADGRAGAPRCPSGSVVSEGDRQLRAKKARSAFGVDGSGQTVGILSDSFNQSAGAHTHEGKDVRTGDLPGSKNPCGFTARTEILDDSFTSGGIDEGRAMAQIVHDLAPGADLAFATAFTGEKAFADNIRALDAAGADVIVDDVVYFDEPFFQDGIVSGAVNDVTADGVTYVSAAGNENVTFRGHRVGSWEAPAFRATGCPKIDPITKGVCMDFDPTAGRDNGWGLKLPPGRDFILDLQWAQPWYLANMADYDLYVIDQKNRVVADSTADQPSSHKPFEALFHANRTDQPQHLRIVINRTGGGSPRLKFLFSGGTGIRPEYTRSSHGDVMGPTIFGHSGAANTLSTAAVRYDDSSRPEFFTSHGPVTLYYGPINGTSPAALLVSPDVVAKPDVAATDGGVTTFFYPPPDHGDYRFYGTSAAAPHAAAVAALLLDQTPSSTDDEIKTAMRDSAAPVGHFGKFAVGSGLVNAFKALGIL